MTRTCSRSSYPRRRRSSYPRRRWNSRGHALTEAPLGVRWGLRSMQQRGASRGWTTRSVYCSVYSPNIGFLIYIYRFIVGRVLKMSGHLIVISFSVGRPQSNCTSCKRSNIVLYMVWPGICRHSVVSCSSIRQQATSRISRASMIELGAFCRGRRLLRIIICSMCQISQVHWFIPQLLFARL